MTQTLDAVASHPAKFSNSVLSAASPWISEESGRLGRSLRILDPFAGVGKVHTFQDQGHTTVGVELEPEWGTQHPSNVIGNVLDLSFLPHESFDVMFTSPCLEQSHRILTADLRWVPVGEVQEGDEVMAFDEHGNGRTAGGRVSRRRWRRATVVRSIPRSVECVRVILDNGDEILTTPEHPWLSYRYGYPGAAPTWVASKDLMSAPWVMRQTDTWTPRTSFDAGWLSGMFDGEGSLSMGTHGSPKMTLCQVDGPLLDRAERLMNDFGYEPNRIWRKNTPEHRQKVGNLYVTGGFPGMMKALGELRPERLLAKWESLDVSTRTVEAQRVQVLAVEPAGRRDIQEIQTSEGTYIGEGYLMHNCYGNRMADHHDAKDPCGVCSGSGQSMANASTKSVMAGVGTCSGCKGTGLSRRNTYTHQLGRKLHEDNSGQLQWGQKYRIFHEKAWQEVNAKVRPGGLFIVNISNHIRSGQEQPVLEWHLGFFMQDLGMLVRAVEPVRTPRNRDGKNAELRVDHEFLLVLRKRTSGS